MSQEGILDSLMIAEALAMHSLIIAGGQIQRVPDKSSRKRKLHRRPGYRFLHAGRIAEYGIICR